MSTNVITFPTNKVVRPRAIKINILLHLIKQIKDYKTRKRKEKLNFLYKKAYRYYYDLLETPQVSGIDLPEFIYEMQREDTAAKLAYKEMFNVIAEERVDKCYRKALKN